MFFIFLFIVAILFVLGMLAFFVANKVYLLIKKQDRQFNMETEVQLEVLKKIKENLKEEEK